MYIHSPPPFKGGKVNFDYLTHGGAGLLKRGGGDTFPL